MYTSLTPDYSSISSAVLLLTCSKSQKVGENFFSLCNILFLTFATLRRTCLFLSHDSTAMPSSSLQFAVLNGPRLASRYVGVLHCFLYCAYCAVLCCTVRTVLCCTVLQCTVLYCTVLYCTVLYCTALCCILLLKTQDY